MVVVYFITKKINNKLIDRLLPMKVVSEHLFIA